MEWDALLADLESRFDAERRAELAAAGADLAEAELGGVRILDRLRNAVGAGLHMRTLSGFAVDGRLLRAGGEVLVIDEGEGLRTLVPVRAIAVVSPLPGPAPAPDPARGGSGGPGLAAALRTLARQGARARLLLAAGEVVGRLSRVGADHVDVLVDGADPAARLEPVRARRGRVSVLLAAVEAVRSR